MRHCTLDLFSWCRDAKFQVATNNVTMNWATCDISFEIISIYNLP